MAQLGERRSEGCVLDPRSLQLFIVCLGFDPSPFSSTVLQTPLNTISIVIGKKNAPLIVFYYINFLLP